MSTGFGYVGTMIDDFEWTRKVVQRCPLWIGELEAEAMVEWVVERADTDYGSIQVEYTSCDALKRPFCGAAVTASVWVLEIDESLGDEVGSYVLEKFKNDFAHIGLAKRWAAAVSEIALVEDANEFLRDGFTILGEDEGWD